MAGYTDDDILTKKPKGLSLDECGKLVERYNEFIELNKTPKTGGHYLDFTIWILKEFNMFCPSEEEEKFLQNMEITNELNMNFGDVVKVRQALEKYGK